MATDSVPLDLEGFERGEARGARVSRLLGVYADIRQAQRVAPKGSVAWYLYGDARAALIQLAAYLDMEEA